MKAYVAVAILYQQHLLAGVTHSSLGVQVIAFEPIPMSSVAALVGVSETVDKQVVMV